jgi:hypothetical protein
MPRSITTFPFKVWHDYRDRPWPLLASGVLNLQVINRSAHVEKCAQEAGERRVDPGRRAIGILSLTI